MEDTSGIIRISSKGHPVDMGENSKDDDFLIAARVPNAEQGTAILVGVTDELGRRYNPRGEKWVRLVHYVFALHMIDGEIIPDQGSLSDAPRVADDNGPEGYISVYTKYQRGGDCIETTCRIYTSSEDIENVLDGHTLDVPFTLFLSARVRNANEVFKHLPPCGDANAIMHLLSIIKYLWKHNPKFVLSCM